MHFSRKSASPFAGSSALIGSRLVGGDGILAAPGRAAAAFVAHRQPFEIGRDGNHFARLPGRQRRRRLRAVLAAHEAVDDAVFQCELALRPPVHLGIDRGDPDQRQRALALAGVQMAVAARHGAVGVGGRFGRCVGEDPIAAADGLGPRRFLERPVRQRIGGNVPRTDHGGRCGHQRTGECVRSRRQWGGARRAGFGGARSVDPW